MATAAGFLSPLRKKLFREEVVEPEVPLDLHKIETVLDATAARLIALESTLFAFKSDIQFRQQRNMLRVAWLAAAHAAAHRSRGPHTCARGCLVDPRGKPSPLGCAEERLCCGLRSAARPKTPMSPSWPCRQQQQEAAARLCMLEGMLFDSEDVFMEQARRACAWCIHPFARACTFT